MIDSRTGRALSPLTQLPSEPMGLAYDAAGRRLAVRCRGGALLLLDAASGRVIRQWAVAPLGEMEQWLVIGGGVCWGPGATTVITWGTDIVEVWETESGTRKYPPLKHNAVCGSVCVSASGQYLATTSWDGAARVWRLSSGELAATLAHGSVVYSAWFTAGDHLLLTHGDGATLRAWDWRTGQRAQGDHLSHPHGADVSPDGRWVIGGVGPRSASVAVAATGAIAAPSIPVTGEPAVIRIAPDGLSAAASGRAEWVDLIRLDALQATGGPTPQWSRMWGELVAGRRIHHGSLVGLTTSEWMNRWEAVAAARPTMPPVPSEAARWHVLRASDAAGARDPMAEAFHLRRLIASSAADWAVHARAAELSTAQCEWAQAAALLEAAARLNPEDEDLLIRRADVLLGLGDEAAAAEAFARVLRLNGRHWVRGGWWTAGPYAGGLSQEPPAEARPEVSAPIAVPTGGQGTRWALHHHTAPSLELHPLFGNAQHVFGYAQTFVYSPDEREVSLGIGADDGVQVWLNGQKVFEHASFLDAGSRTVTVRLKPGINRLLAKVANDRLHHRLYLDLSDGP